MVGPGAEATIRFMDRVTAVGEMTVMGTMRGPFFKAGYDTARFRQAKRELLALIVEWAPRVPRQRASAVFGTQPILRDGEALFRPIAGTAHAAQAGVLLRSLAGGLPMEDVAPVTLGAKTSPYPVLFLGTLAELREAAPALAAHPDLADLSEKYPAGDQFAVRFVTEPLPPRRGKEPLPEPGVSLVVVCPTPAAVERALDRLPRVVSRPRGLYSHWLPAHRED